MGRTAYGVFFQRVWDIFEYLSFVDVRETVENMLKMLGLLLMVL